MKACKAYAIFRLGVNLKLKYHKLKYTAVKGLKPKNNCKSLDDYATKLGGKSSHEKMWYKSVTQRCSLEFLLFVQ